MPPHFKSGAPVGAIAGSVLSGVAIIALLLCLVIYCRRRRRATPRVKRPVYPEPVRPATWLDIDTPTLPPSDGHSSVPPAVSISHISSATPARDTATVTDVPSPIARRDSFYTGLPGDKEMGTDAYAVSEHDELTREAQDLRHRVAVLRAASESGRSSVEPMPVPENTDNCIKEEIPRTPSTSRPTTSIAGSLPMHFENEALRRELNLLRVEMARLQARVVATHNWGPPPAYA